MGDWGGCGRVTGECDGRQVWEVMRGRVMRGRVG